MDLTKCNQFTDLLCREGWTGCVSLGTLDGYQFCFLVDRRADAVVIEGSGPAAGQPDGMKCRTPAGNRWTRGCRSLPPEYHTVFPPAKSSSSPGRRFPANAVRARAFRHTICGRTNASSVWNTSAYTCSSVSRPRSLNHIRLYRKMNIADAVFLHRSDYL